MPPPSVWGPPLWKLLHALGEISKTSLASLRLDSEREAIWIVNHIHTILPCKECIAHLREVQGKYPVPRSYDKIGEWVSKLHNSVNTKLGKPEVEYAPSPTSVKEADEAWGLFLQSIDDSILLGLVTGKDLREFRRHFSLWLRYSG